MTKKKIEWASVALKLIGFLQTIIPTFLFAWVEYLRTKNARLETEISFEKLKQEKKEKRDELKNSDKSSFDRVNEFLRDK